VETAADDRVNKLDSGFAYTGTAPPTRFRPSLVYSAGRLSELDVSAPAEALSERVA
jgi:hypothetical protein